MCAPMAAYWPARAAEVKFRVDVQGVEYVLDLEPATRAAIGYPAQPIFLARFLLRRSPLESVPLSMALATFSSA